MREYQWLYDAIFAYGGAAFITAVIIRLVWGVLFDKE